jgi:hypothetical protein
MYLLQRQRQIRPVTQVAHHGEIIAAGTGVGSPHCHKTTKHIQACGPHLVIIDSPKIGGHLAVLAIARVERRTQAKVPEEVIFQTKPEQAMAMLEQVWQAGVPMRWVAGDEIYGDSSELRDLIARHERWYVLAVRTPTSVWTARPQVVAPEPQERGRPRTKVRLAEGAPSATTVKAVVASWPESR